MVKTKHHINKEELKQLLFLSEENVALVSKGYTFTEFEKDFLNGFIDRYNKYGTRFVLTQSQSGILEAMHFKAFSFLKKGSLKRI